MNFNEELKKEAFDFAFAVHRVTEFFPKEEALRKELREYSAGLLAKVSSLELSETSEKLTLVRNILAALEALKNLLLLSQKAGLMKIINAEVLDRERTALEIYFQHEHEVLGREQTIREQKKKDETRPKAKVQNDIEPINLAPLREENSKIGLKTHSKNIEYSERCVVNDTKISVSDILKAQKQEIRAPLATPSASTNNNVAEINGSPDNTDNDGINDRQGAIIGYLKANKEARMIDLVTIFSNRFSIKTLQRDLARLITNGEVMRQGDKRWAIYRLNGGMTSHYDI